MLEENIELDGVDDICCTIEDLPDQSFLPEILFTYSISAPLN